jgi:Fe-S cluster assembly iron-binding protein IscA
MLELTDAAAEAVRAIVASTDSAETGGLRVVASADGDLVSLEFNVAVIPAEDDEVVEEDGARVFLESMAAMLLEHKQLDASMDGGQIAFILSDQTEG